MIEIELKDGRVFTEDIDYNVAKGNWLSAKNNNDTLTFCDVPIVMDANYIIRIEDVTDGKYKHCEVSNSEIIEIMWKDIQKLKDKVYICSAR